MLALSFVCYHSRPFYLMEMQYSALDQKRTIAVQSLQECLGFHSNINLENAIDWNIPGTCQFNQRDIQIANKIYGPSVAAIKGKSTKCPNKMDRPDILTEIPKEIMDAYKKVHLDINIMFANDCAYFTAISQHIGLIHCCVIASRNNKWVVSAMQLIINQYSKHGFAITTIHRDNKFEQLDDWLTLCKYRKIKIGA